MTIEVKVPLLPESITDATVSTWHKKTGDKVSRDENLLDLETDKVMLEVPSPADGVLKEIKQKTGATVHAQEVIAIIEEGAIAKPSVPAEKKIEKAEKEQTEKTASIPAEGKPVTEPSLGPAARRAIAEHEVDLSQLRGTGKDGRITKENIIA